MYCLFIQATGETTLQETPNARFYADMPENITIKFNVELQEMTLNLIRNDHISTKLKIFLGRKSHFEEYRPVTQIVCINTNP